MMNGCLDHPQLPVQLYDHKTLVFLQNKTKQAQVI